MKNAIKIAKEILAVSGAADYVIVKIPRTDFDASEFEKKASSIIKKAGGDLVSSRQVSGSWMIVWEIPAEVNANEVISRIEKLPEWKLPKQFGAKVTIE